MALPSTFANSHEYFSAAVRFLRQHSWIYQYANTCFIKANVLDKFPKEYIEYFSQITNDDLNQFPFLNNDAIDLHLDCQSIIDFRTELKTLIPLEAYSYEDTVDEALVKQYKFSKIGLKKQHEIVQLAVLIHSLCLDDYVLVDFGAGLGYLCEMLYKLNDKYLILGLESARERVETAQKRQQENIPQTINSIMYKEEFITVESHVQIDKWSCELRRKHDEQSSAMHSKMAIIGLHACADLTITSMRLFFRMPIVDKLIIMPCCYHKLQVSNCDATKFINFPLSTCLKGIVQDDTSSVEYFNRPFLRLACQQTMARWRNYSPHEHYVHGKAMLRRALAEALAGEGEVIVKRKEAQQKIHDVVNVKANTFADLCQHYELKSKDTNTSLAWCGEHERKFHDIIHRYGGNEKAYKLAEGLTCLQTTMQKLCENIVLYDRLCYLQEYARSVGANVRVSYQKLLNEKISPRCYVLIAEKL